jgi:hypothetical protein
MRRETSRVSFLLCPFCVRGLVPGKATRLRHRAFEDAVRKLLAEPILVGLRE